MKLFRLGLLSAFVFFLGIPVVANAQPVPPDCMQGPHIRCDVPHCSKFCNNGHHHGKHNPPPPAPKPAPPAPPHHAKPAPPAPPAPPHHAKPAPPAPPAPPHHAKPVPPPPPAPPVVVAPPPPGPHFAALERELRDRRADNDRMQHELAIARDRANHEYERCMRIMYPFNGGCKRSTPETHSLETRIHDNEREIRRLEHELHIR